MKRLMLTVAALGAAMTVVGCNEQPVQRVYVPGPEEQSAYRPEPMQKPLPPEGYIPGMMPPPQPYPGQGQAMSPQGMPPQGMPPQGMPPPGMPPMQQPGSLAAPSIPNEDAFVQAYVNRRSPRIMIFVNRTIQGDPLPKDGLNEVLRVEDRQSATGAVNVNNNRSNIGNSQSTSSGFYGGSASNSNTNRTSSSSFVSGGPADYTHTTSVRTPADKYDWIGATPDDYAMIEASLIDYFDNSGKVRVQDSDAARSRLSREQVLRIENGDPAAARLLNSELQQEVLIRVTAVPTRQASQGAGIRLMAKAVSTTDARNLGTAYVDMPPQLSKTNINIYTRYLASELMGKMAQKWSQPPEYDPITVRIYKAASIDDTLAIRKWLQNTQNVRSVQSGGATGGSQTAYAILNVGFQGAPEDLYANLKEAIGLSQGLKAVDLQNNTISLEVTGPMNLVTTTRRSETKTTTETTTTEERRVEPINPAPQQ